MASYSYDPVIQILSVESDNITVELWNLQYNLGQIRCRLILWYKVGTNPDEWSQRQLGSFTIESNIHNFMMTQWHDSQLIQTVTDLEPNTDYYLDFLVKKLSDMQDQYDWNGCKFASQSFTTLPAPQPQPIPEPQPIYLFLQDNNANDVTGGQVSFTGTSPDSPFDDGILNLIVSNGYWTIQNATAGTEYHIGVSSYSDSSDATLYITSDGTPGTYKLDFYLDNVLMTCLNINVN